MMEVKSEYKMTDVGEIPAEWEVRSLSSVLDIRDGTHDSPRYIQKGVPFLTSKNLGRGKLTFKEVNYITDEDHKKFSERSLVENGDILFGMIGTVGNPVIVDLPYSISIKNVALVKFHKSNMNNKYVLECLNSQNILKQFKKESNGGVQKFIALGKIRKLKITVPSIKEQQKIAEILSTVDEQIEQTDKLIEKTKELKKGLMQQFLTKGIGHTEFKQSELGEIPIEWEICSLKNLGMFLKGKGIAKKDLSISGRKCILYGQLYTTHNEIIKEVTTYTDSEIMNPVIGQKNDLLIPSSGETPIDIATASSLNVDKVYIGGDINLFRAANQINSDFLSYQINSVRKFELSKLAQGSSIYHLYKNNLENFSVTVPPLKEQKKITRIITSVDEAIEGYQQEKSKYEELKKGLMQQLLTGKTRVKVD